jgi:DNA-binding NarL/FixJ family response regulator
VSLLGDVFPNLGAMGPAPSSDMVEHSIILGVEEDALFQGLAHAMTLAFPNYTARFDEKLDAPHSPALILLPSDKSDNLLATLAGLKTRYPTSVIGVVVVHGKSCDGELLSAAAAQNLAHGVLPISLSLRVWLAAVWLLLNGGRYLPPSLWSHGAEPSFTGLNTPVLTAAPRSLISPELNIAPDQLENLTGREREVLRLLSKGFQNKIIAARLDLSEHTIKIHVHNIIRKLGVHNRTQVAWLFRNKSDDHE